MFESMHHAFSLEPNLVWAAGTWTAIGRGQCTDARGHEYRHLGVYNVPSVSACQALCETYASPCIGVTVPSNECRILYDSTGPAPKHIHGYTLSYDEGHPGYGPVVGANGATSYNFRCYSYDAACLASQMVW